ncbi:hypothetical protein ACH5RR_012994 [Cinchona calisaya]|uniref:Uncharacterized protein n=1 Tax=Cinchona calisaya TaxID=153742 RepID=A0ABD2ZYX2_9GENT
MDKLVFEVDDCNRSSSYSNLITRLSEDADDLSLNTVKVILCFQEIDHSTSLSKCFKFNTLASQECPIIIFEGLVVVVSFSFGRDASSTSFRDAIDSRLLEVVKDARMVLQDIAPQNINGISCMNNYVDTFGLSSNEESRLFCSAYAIANNKKDPLWKLIANRLEVHSSMKYGELKQSKLGQSDERLIQEQRLHRVVTQREELQEMETDLHTKLIARGEIMEKRNSYDAHIKKHEMPK